MKDTRPCSVCGKHTDILELLVGEKVYCSQDCWETDKFGQLKQGLETIVSSMEILNNGGSLEQTQKATKVLQRLKENVCQRKTWKEIRKEIENLGTNN